MRLGQILINLIGNAIKFTKEGEVLITVSCIEETPASAVLKFEVKDTGIGIQPAALERIFHPFAQEDGSTTRRFGGTGLGLTIVRQLIKTMQGI